MTEVSYHVASACQEKNGNNRIGKTAGLIFFLIPLTASTITVRMEWQPVLHLFVFSVYYRRTYMSTPISPDRIYFITRLKHVQISHDNGITVIMSGKRKYSLHTEEYLLARERYMAGRQVRKIG